MRIISDESHEPLISRREVRWKSLQIKVMRPQAQGKMEESLHTVV